MSKARDRYAETYALLAKNGGAAFPMHWEEGGEQVVVGGMTLRDYFAGQAIVGFINIAPDPDVRAKQIGMAAWAYDIADEMLKARAREKTR